MKEREIRALLKQRVEAYGGQVRAVSWLGRRGAPDVLCLFPSETLGGLNIWVETKRPGEKPTPQQEREHALMRQAGCRVLIIATPADLDRWLPPKGEPK